MVFWVTLALALGAVTVDSSYGFYHLAKVLQVAERFGFYPFMVLALAFLCCLGYNPVKKIFLAAFIGLVNSIKEAARWKN